jgi:hypothetical protein
MCQSHTVLRHQQVGTELYPSLVLSPFQVVFGVEPGRKALIEEIENDGRFNLKRSVGQGEVCVCGDAGQGAATRNSQLFQGVATPPWAATSVQFTL